jgi:hypothetical protein
LMKRSRNSYIRSPRNVTFAPMPGLCAV